jgi:hypothetical protein
MRVKIFKVAFEHVSVIRYPQYYRGDQPCVTPAAVPEEHWTSTEVERDEAAARVQIEGLHTLVARGELVRNVRLFEADAPQVEWRESEVAP